MIIWKLNNSPRINDYLYRVKITNLNISWSPVPVGSSRLIHSVASHEIVVQKLTDMPTVDSICPIIGWVVGSLAELLEVGVVVALWVVLVIVVYVVMWVVVVVVLEVDDVVVVYIVLLVLDQVVVVVAVWVAVVNCD